MKTKLFKCTFCGNKIVRKDDGRIHFCSLTCKSKWQKLAKPVTKEWLIEHYITKRMDTTQISHLVNRNPKSVWNWLKDFGIETRPRGGFTLPHAFKKGQVNLFQGKKHSEETKQKMREIALADGRVPYDPAVGSYMKGRTGSSHPNWKGGITPERQEFYASEKWHKASKKVWTRDSATCQRCGRRKNDDRSIPFDIHHIVGFQNKKQRCKVSNLVLLCEPCHYWVHGKNNIQKLWIK